MIAALNNEITRATSMKPVKAIAQKNIPRNDVYGKRDSFSQPLLGNVTVRYLYEPGELEGGKKKEQLILSGV